MTAANAGPTEFSTDRGVDEGVRIQGIVKSFASGKTRNLVLDDVSLTIGRGEFVSLIGPSGCGKSTILRILAGLIEADAGRVVIDGEDVKAATRDKAIGLVPQSPALLPWRTVLSNVKLALDINRAANRERNLQDPEAVLRSFGLGNALNLHPSQLSGGMQQRAAIARAFVFDPGVLLMDEPFSALDELTRDQQRLGLLKFWQSNRKAVLFVTHSVREAVVLSDRIVVMSTHPGRVKSVIDVDLARPRGEDVYDSAGFRRVEAEVRGVLHEVTELPMPEIRDELALETQIVAEAGHGVGREAETDTRRTRGARLAKLRVRVWLPPLIAFAIAIAIWEWYAHGHPHAIPTIGMIWDSLKGQPGVYWHNFLTTLKEIAIGASGGIVVAFLLAILMAELPVFERGLMPLAVMLMVTPVIAIAPALVIAFGFGMFPKYLLTGIVVFFPMLVNSLAGLRNVEPGALDVFTTLHANRWETFRYLRLPGSLPFVFAGLRICLPLSVVGATVAEFAAAGQQSGLGSLIEVSASEVDLPVIWASIVILCALGIAFVVVLAIVHRRVLWWDHGLNQRA